MTPSSSVSDDVPIFDDDPHGSAVRLVLEAELGDPHDVAVRAPARDSSRGTPSRLSWWSMYDSASGVVTSLSATTRSTWRPTQPELVLADALDPGAVGLGPDDDDALVLGLLAAGLVHQRRHARRPARARPGR